MSADNHTSFIPRPTPRPLVFIAGCPRSGTTWLQRMLREHPDIDGPGPELQLHHAVGIIGGRDGGLTDPEVRRRLMQRYDGSAVWELLGAEVFGAEVEAIVAATMQQRLLPMEQGVGLAVGLMQRVRDGMAGVTTVVEKTPEHLLIAEGLLELLDNAVLIEVVRDGRDVSVSMEDRNGRRPGIYPPTTAARAALWRRYIECGRTLATDDRFASRWLTVRYEHLKQRPAPCLAHIFQWCGAATTAKQCEDIAHRLQFSRGFDPALGDQQRKGIVGDWRNAFSADDIADFDRAAGPTLAILGYTPRARAES